MSKALERDLYEDDFFAWTQTQARQIRRFARTRPNLPLDLAHLAEEIADLGKEQRNALRSWTVRILEHLLLLEHSPADAPRRGWIDEILDCRREIDLRLSATLKRDLSRQLQQLYDYARRHLRSRLEPYGEAEIGPHLARPLPLHPRPSPRRLLAAPVQRDPGA
jgi:Domain of unknown function DUF29